jgi:flagellar biosynthetic protein FlhB
VSSDKASKTEKATPKKVSDARKKGQVAKSQEVAAWTSTLAMTLLLPLTFSSSRDHVLRLVDRLPDLIADPETGTAVRLLGDGMRGALLAVVPMAVGLMLVGVGANVAQVGLTLSPQALQPKLTKLNPLPGLKRMFGTRSLWGAGKELLKLGLLGGFAYHSIGDFVPHLLSAGGLTLTDAMSGVAGAALSFLRWTAALGLALAAADYAYERHHLAKELRMSLQEVKDEHKQADGDPQMKSMVRERQLRMSRNRMMADVATADVVLVNPTHVAVALTYDPASGAPRVVAKGQGVIATKIRERAHEHRVPLVKDVPLARAVHGACEVGDEIPPELYAAIARVLAFLFSLKARGVAAGTHVVPGTAPALAA